MDFRRAYFVLVLAEMLPWYLDFLAVWMLNYERRRIERMLAEMCAAIGAFAKAAMRQKRYPRSVAPWEWGSMADLGAIFSGAHAKRAAEVQAHAMMQQQLLQQSVLRQQLYGHMAQQYQQRRSLLDETFGNIFNGFGAS